VLRDGIERIERAVRGLFGILEANEQIARHFDGYVVSRNGRLGRNIQGAFANVNDVTDLIDNGNGEEPTGILNAVQFTEAFHHVLVTLRDNVENRVVLDNGPLPRIAAACTSAAASEGVESVCAHETSMLLWLV
jgi:hypothetical protein